MNGYKGYCTGMAVEKLCDSDLTARAGASTIPGKKLHKNRPFGPECEDRKQEQDNEAEFHFNLLFLKRMQGVV